MIDIDIIIDYDAIKKKIEPFKEELIAKIWHPSGLMFKHFKEEEGFMSDDDW